MNNKILERIKHLDKFKLINIISTIYYYYKITGNYNNMMSTVELEYILNCIYETTNIETQTPTKEDIILILGLPDLMLKQNLKINLEATQEEIIFTQAKNNFLYEKEDTEYDCMIFEYLNLFNPLEHFFKTYYLFKIENFLYFSKLIQMEYFNRIKLIEKVLCDTYKQITYEILIEYLIDCNCTILNFNENTLLDNNIDVTSLSNILKKFSTDELKCSEKGFENYPIFKKGNTYVVSSIVKLLYTAKHIFEKDIRKDIILGTFYAKIKGEYLEILTQDVLKDILKDADIFPNIKYRENKHDRECDLLVIFDKIILIVEIKSRAFKKVSKEGAKTYLNQDLDDNIYKAYKQATRMEKYLLENNEVCFQFGKENKKLNDEY